MTDPLTALALFVLAAAMVIAVIGGGVLMSVRAGNADHPPVHREPAPEPAPLDSGETPPPVALAS